MVYKRESNLRKNNFGTVKTRVKAAKKKETGGIARDQTLTEAELQKEIVKRLRCYQDLFIIYNDPVSPALKFISDNQNLPNLIKYITIHEDS